MTTSVWTLGWNNDGPKTEFAEKDDATSILSHPYGIVLITPEGVDNDEVERVIRICDFDVHWVARVATKMGWRVDQMWENAPNRDLTGGQSPWFDGGMERSPQ